jgi:hypothetical protein
MRKQTNTLSPSPKGFQSPKVSDSDFREVLGLGRPKSSANNNIVGLLYGVPHGILRVFNTILYKIEFQSPPIFQQTISLFPRTIYFNPTTRAPINTKIT